MSALSNLNPDFYHTIVKGTLDPDRDCQVIYSTLDKFSLSAADTPVPGAFPIDSDKDLLVYADTLTIYGNITIPAGNIQIVARTLILQQPVTLDITPPPPTNTQAVTAATPASGQFAKSTTVVGGTTLPYPTTIEWSEGARSGAAGNAGLPGAAGPDNLGTIRVVVETWPKTNVSLTLVARGGKGQPGHGGQDGSPGEAGVSTQIDQNAGPEAFSPVGDETFPVGAYSNDCDHNWTPVEFAGHGGSGGTGGDGGSGGSGGAGGRIELKLPAEANRVKMDAGGGDHGDDGTPGKGGTEGMGGIQTIQLIGTSYVSGKDGHPVLIWGPKDIQKVNGPDGVKGDDGNSPDRTDDPGVGEAGITTRDNLTPVLLAQAFDATFLLKLLQRGKNLYFLRAQSSDTTVKPDQTPEYKIFEWLVQTLGALITSKDQKQDPEAQRKQVIFDQASALRLDCLQGRNQFGKMPNWVPRRSLDQYNTDMQALLGPLQKIEASFTKLLQENSTIDQIDDQLSDSIQNLEDTQTTYASKIADLAGALPDLVTQLDALTQELSDIKVGLTTTVQDYEQAVKNYVDCSLDSIFKSLEMVAFNPEDVAMIAVQGSELMYNSLTKMAGYKKEYIIQKLELLENDLHSELTEKYKQYVVQGSDGTLTFKGDQTPLLIANLESFEKEMSKVNQLIPDQATALSAATTNLKGTLQSRGNRLLEYNSIMRQIVQLQAQQSDLDTQKASIQGKLYQNTDPTRAGTVSFFAVLYQNLLNQAMEVIYMANRALAFWSAGMAHPKNGFASFQDASLWADGPNLTQFTSANLLGAITDMTKQMQDQQEKFGRPDMTFPSDPKSKSEIIVSITKPSDLEAFRHQRKLNFTVVPSSSTKPGEFFASHTDDKYDIRVWYVRPRLIGAKVSSGDGIVEIQVAHLGDDRLMQQDGTMVSFMHDPVLSQFAYKQVASSEKKDYGMGGDGSFYKGKDDGYAPLGLFANWQIELISPEEKELDLTGLSEIEIEIGVLAQPKGTASDDRAK